MNSVMAAAAAPAEGDKGTLAFELLFGMLWIEEFADALLFGFEMLFKLLFEELLFLGLSGLIFCPDTPDPYRQE